MDVNFKLDRVTCPACGMPFGMPDYWIDTLRRTGRSFLCPNGHVLSFEVTSKQEKPNLSVLKGGAA